MNHSERLKLLLRSQFFYLGVLMLVVGIAICSIVSQNSDAQLPAAILAQGGIIVGFWAYRRTRFIVTAPASQAILKRRSRMGVALGIGMICVCFMLTPVILWSVMPQMQGFLFWYVAATGLVGLSGLVGLFVWLKRSSD